ncbi:unnamed protein product [Parnassius apollo]|uniref:(apollo) hypothetical protein n=1 Tax=Parnassius apollo TaxID=110799 RepID=A0A8S3X8B9_PARAO|nr:unnamed protein product [Parnassius apollo]
MYSCESKIKKIIGESISLPIFTLSGRRPLRQLEYSSKPVPSTSSGCAAGFTTTFFETDFTEKENIEPMTNIQLHSHKENEVVLARKEIKQLSRECRTPSLAVTQKIKKTIATTHAENKLYLKLVQVKNKLAKCRTKVKQ